MLEASSTSVTFSRVYHEMSIEQFKSIELMLARATNIRTFSTYFPTTIATTRYNTTSWSSNLSSFLFLFQFLLQRTVTHEHRLGFDLYFLVQ